MAFRSIVRSAGELVAVEAERAWAGRLVSRAVGGNSSPASGEPTVRLRIEASTRQFPRAGLRLVTRGAYSDGLRTVLVDACGSGFDLQVVADDPLELTARYRPGCAVRAVNRLLARRFGLLAGQVLVHYPVLWRAGWRGRVPLHACVLRTDSGTLLLAGPGGVGKSTMLLAALAAGGTATADNLCCADAIRCFGVAEPLRTDAPAVSGRRTSHGRVEVALNGREPVLEPDRIVALERGPYTEISPVRPEDAARALVAGTYAAGELRRYWAFAATLAFATGRGPAHPPIADIAAGYAERLPCLRVRVGDGAVVSVAQLCGTGGLSRGAERSANSPPVLVEEAP
jgi:hypothetical protein